MFRFSRTPKPEDLDKKLVFSLHRSVKTGLPRLKQLRFLPRLLTAQERWIFQGGLALFLILVSSFIGLTLRRHLTSLPRNGGIYREAFQGVPRVINPVLAVSDVDKDLSRLIYSGLLKYNNEGELVPDLAQEFSIENSGKTLRFVLREGVFWHDGEPVTINDVTFTLEAIQSASWRSSLWQTFQGVTLEQVDERTILAHAAAFSPSFASIFTVGILPEHIWSEADPRNVRLANWNLKPIGTGPFRFKSLTKSADGTLSFYRLVRYEEYYGKKPYLKELVAQFFSDFDAALAAFRTHVVDGVSFVPERLRSKVPASGTTLHKLSFPRFTGLFFQDRKNDVLKDKAVRLSLALALNREAIVAKVPNAELAFTPFMPWQVGFARTLNLPEYNLKQARETLEAAGWKQTDGKWIKENKNLRLTLTSLDDPVQLAVADTIKSAWEELGVEVKLEAVSRYIFGKEVLQPRTFEVALFSFVTGRDPDPYPFWHSTQLDDPGVNLSSVRSRPLDSSLELGRATADEKTRLLNYVEFQKKFLEEVPGIILYSNPYIYVTAKRVRGMETKLVTAPADRFNDVTNWFVRSRLGWR